MVPSGIGRSVSIWLAWWSISCGDSGARPASSGASDSGGITAPRPLLVLGDWSGDDGTDFQDIVGAFVDREAGVLVIGNSGDGTVRFFSIDGGPRRSLGGIGEGPDEFQSLGGVFEYRGDSVLAFDRWEYRASVWPYAGGRVRWVSVEDLPVGLRFPTLRGSLRDGRLLWTAEAIDDRYDEPGVSHSRLVTVFLTSPEGRGFQVVGETAGAMLYRYRTSRFARGMAPFSPRSFAAADDSVVYFGSTRFPQAMRVNPAGMPLESVRFDSGRRATSPAQREADLTIRRSEVERERRPSTPLRAARLAELELLPYPDSLPAMGAIVVGRDGRLWVADYVAPQNGANQAFPGSRRWAAYSELAMKRQAYHFPERFRLFWADEAMAVGVVQDSLGVERIVVASVSPEEGDGSR
jgi:hypothetical protein